MLPLAWQGEVVPPAASKGKGKGNQKDKEAGWMQPRLGGCYKSGKDYRPPITTEWFCIAFCGINWLVPKDTHRNPLTTVVDCDSFGSSWILLGQAENISLVSLFFLVWSSLGCGFPFSRGRLVKKLVISIRILSFGFP